ncbi:MAG: transcriptional regulator [Spirochaetaceae bacterium]|nr:transcriptional regulator [Spirochaetaceae bacterium]
MENYKLLISIVPHDRGERLIRAAMESGCQGGTVLSGRGLAATNIAAILGLGEEAKDIILMIVDENVKKSVTSAIISTAKTEKRNFGELFSLDLGTFYKSGKQSGEENMAKTDCDNTMITVIVNKGYADDVMAAARSAGAGGGTVVNARGTARETDARFFGMHIVPEKDMLIMVVPADKKKAVINAIENVKCLKEPGMGIAYSSAVEDFTTLGKKK